MRPQFHFTAATGWINDPHGITYRNGGYDVFYQYVPGRTEWAPNCHWGHARGTDLFSLVERRPALLPGGGDDGIWTGSLVTDGKDARIFYTSVGLADLAIGKVRVATADDDSWDAWTKAGTVIEAPPGLDLVGFRDPFLRRDPDAWRAFLGAGSAAGDALALSYVSPDGEEWSYEGVALRRSSAERDPAWMGAMWECPQIFDLDGRQVMLSSAWDRDVLNYAGYAIGRYERGQFTAEAWGRLTFGPSYYAPSFFRDAEGRACMTLWMRGIDDREAGWAGAHSIPYVLSLRGDVLVANPHPDLDAYRGPACTDGRLAGTAADVRWEGAGMLEVTSGLTTLFAIDGSGDSLVITIGDERTELPRHAVDVRVVIDATSLEIVTDRGVFADAIPAPVDGLSISGDGVDAGGLSRAGA